MQSQTSAAQNRHTHNSGAANFGCDPNETLRNAYNAAFDEMELGWQWGVSPFRELQRHADERARIHAYLSAQRPHLLKAYDGDFLWMRFVKQRPTLTANWKSRAI